jgi:dTDP-4-amino-4,6-dideoxygalactose transaminase
LVDKYTWRDVGSSYLPSGILAAFLLEQLNAREHIQAARRRIFERYQRDLAPWARDHGVHLPTVPSHCDQAYHMFYMILPSNADRTRLLAHLKAANISATFHYVPLHTSPMGQTFGGSEGMCPVTEDRSARLIRLPFYTGMTDSEQARVLENVLSFKL